MPAHQPTRTAVAIVSFNTREHLRNCLASVQSEVPSEIIVVDNDSHDGSVEMVLSDYPNVRLQKNDVNVGYGSAANQAIAMSTADYVLLLNSDTRLTAGALRALTDYLEQHREAGIAGPRLANPDGTLQISCFHFPTPFHTFVRESSLAAVIARQPLLRERYLPTSAHTYARAVPWVLGAALMIRRTAFESVGGFDQAFFMYSEEVDLCYRLHKAGWQTHFTPAATVIHVGEASTSQRRVEMGVKLYSSMRLFYQHHYSRSRMLQLRLVIIYVVVRNIIYAAIQRRRTEHARDRARLTDNILIWKRVLADTLRPGGN